MLILIAFCSTNILYAYSINVLKAQLEAVNMEISTEKDRLREEQSNKFLTPLYATLALVAGDVSCFTLMHFIQLSPQDSKDTELVKKGVRFLFALGAIICTGGTLLFGFLSASLGLEVVLNNHINRLDAISKLEIDDMIGTEFKYTPNNVGFTVYEYALRKRKLANALWIAQHDSASQRVIDAIVDGEIFLGMERKYLLISWGKPEDINKSVGSWGTHEQFVYGSQYVYVENGVVTSWQN